MVLFTSLSALLLYAIILSVTSCPDDFVPWHEGYCYKIDVGQRNCWDETVEYCRDAGGELASIHSALENRRIVDTLRSLGQTAPLWLGLQCVGVASWVDHTPVNYRNFSLSLCGGTSNSVMWTIDSTGAWTKRDICFASTSGLCRHRRRNGQRCSDYDEVEGTNACIGIHNDPKSWWLAEIQCQQEGGHLLSLHDQMLNNHISKRIRDAEMFGTSGAFHIGLQTQASPKGEIMTWSDGSAVNYTNFDIGYPFNAWGQCTAMQSTLSGKWITAQCSYSELPYICSRPVNDPIEASGCPNNANFKDSGTILSPSYPAGSGPLNHCEYFITVPKGKKVNLDINDLNMNLCCDKLLLYDGLAASTPFATLSGKATQASYTTPTGNVLKMVYTSTDGTFVRGWKVTFKGV